MRIAELIHKDTIARFAETIGHSKLVENRVTKKAGKYLGDEFKEWKDIVKEHPVQTALAASGLLLALNLRLGEKAISGRKFKTFFKKALKAIPRRASRLEAAAKTEQSLMKTSVKAKGKGSKRASGISKSRRKYGNSSSRAAA
jgi:hypothetical protein